VRRFSPNPRGMALVMAMIVVVLITLLVAGAISFTGTERAASEVQTQEDGMSSCAQAARNLFLSKVKMSMLAMEDPDHPSDPSLPPDPNVPKVLPVTFEEDLRGTNLRTGHLGEIRTWSAKKVSVMDDPLAQVNDNMMVTGDAHVPTFYTVSAVCRETAELTSPEREIEFMVRVGF
jgi:hypothetical protein